jgi:hypothetical protein
MTDDQTREALVASENRKLARARDYRNVFGTKQGERVLADLIREHGLLDHCIEENPYQTYRKLGERNVLIRILKLLNVDEREFIKRIENLERNET